jgi:hypothetical protein
MVRAASSSHKPLHPGLDPVIAEQRNEQGRIAEFTAGTPDPKVAEVGPPTYFRTYDQVKGAMQELATKYPNLVSFEDIGDSGEKTRGSDGRDILALRLTNKNAAGDKPKAFMFGGEHAREIANPELLMRWAQTTLEGYGKDPEATALLDSREIDIVPIMNPDGHAVVEQGYTEKNGVKLWNRKNTTPPSGVDPNRNYDFHWGTGGSSANPRSDIYRGASPASESEVQAIQKFATENKPGIMIDWHSYSRLNLYPWGYTHDKAPDAAGLKAVAKKFSTFNHYTPEPGINLYMTSGTSKDWGYGAQKIPSFIVETGDDFHQDDKQFEENWRQNSPVLNYAAKIADKPYERAAGPDAVDVLFTPDKHTVTAQLKDSEDVVTGAELVTDPHAAPGTGVPLLPADGAWDSSNELANLDVPGALTRSTEPRLGFVRAQDAKGNWGPLTAQWLSPPTESSHNDDKGTQQ